MSIVNSIPSFKRSIVIRGGGVITMDPKLGDFDTADVHIRDGIIMEIGTDLQVSDAEVIDASNMIVMPGFVDGHRHLWEGMIRGTLPTEDLLGYFKHVNKGFAPAYAAEDAYLGTLVSALGALDSGVTTVFDWSHIQITPEHTEAAISALRESGLRTIFGFALPNGHASPEEFLQLQKQEFSSTDQLLTLAVATLSPEMAPDAMVKSHFNLASEAGLIVSIHAGTHGVGNPNEIERIGREGLLGPHVNLVHCNTLSDTEWKIIADTGASVGITPTVEMQMGHGIPPIQQALNAGIKPSLGVDVETSAPADMWTQMRSIYGLQRQEAFKLKNAGKEAPAMLEVNDVLEFATMAGATAGRLENKVGSLTPGKQADIILLRTDMLNVMPVSDMKTAVMLNMDPRNVDTVMVAGKIVKRNGQMIGVDMEKLGARLYENRDRMFAKANFPCNSPTHRLKSK